MQIQMPSGNKAMLNIMSDGKVNFGMNLDLYIAESFKTEGLCGSYDLNATNDLKYNGRDQVADISNSDRLPPADYFDSWRFEILAVYSERT